MLNKLILKSSISYKHRAAKTIYKLLFLIVFGVFLSAFSIHLSPVCLAQKVDTQDDERQILAEMRIAKKNIETRQWEKARLKLKKIITDFPQDQHLDIAYYWLAYTLFQQKKLAEADEIIGVLRFRFPDSLWLNESKSLSAEIGSQSGRQLNFSDEEFSRSSDETKSFVLQNLLKTDRSKALAKIDEIFSSTSNASSVLKESVLILLFDDDSEWATDKFIDVIKTEKSENLLKHALIGLRKKNEKKALPALLSFLRQNDNENLLDAAFYTVSGFSEEEAIKTLLPFAKSGGNEELKQKSIIWLGNIGSQTAIQELENLYSFYQEFELKQQVQIALSEADKPEALMVLIELIESESNKNLVKHGLELLKRKKDPLVLKYLEKKLATKN